MKRVHFLPLLAGVMLLAPLAARAAEIRYTFQPLAAIGGTAGDVPIPKGLIWFLGPLNDNGQLLCALGTINFSKPEMLFQYGDGKFTPIVLPETDGPAGKWPKVTGIAWPIDMNTRGNSVFTVVKSNSALGTFNREAGSGKLTSILLKGMPASADLTFTDPGGFSPAISGRDEMAVVGSVKPASGSSGYGLFFRTTDGALQPIFLPGQALADGKKGQPTSTPHPSITDAGVVGFQLQRAGDNQYSAYQWEKGNLTPLLTVGTEIPGVGKIAAVSSVRLNNKNRNALVSVRLEGATDHGLYLLADGKMTPVAAPGQEMPGGGKFKTMGDLSGGPLFTLSVSAATEAGQHAFVARLDDGSRAVYRMEADGTPSLVLKMGATTPLGKVTGFGPYSPPAINSKGQVVVTAGFDGGPDTLVLLTPAVP
jgi:hypothetical protein